MEQFAAMTPSEKRAVDVARILSAAFL